MINDDCTPLIRGHRGLAGDSKRHPSLGIGMNRSITGNQHNIHTGSCTVPLYPQSQKRMCIIMLRCYFDNASDNQSGADICWRTDTNIKMYDKILARTGAALRTSASGVKLHSSLTFIRCDRHTYKVQHILFLFSCRTSENRLRWSQTWILPSSGL
jgi:hypothetical protein